MRSTTAPEMSAGVMTANMAWNSMKAACGMVGARSFAASAPTPRRPAKERPPSTASMPPAPGENARL
jgi:hypothetical protein